MGVELQRIVEKMKLKNLTPEVDLTKREVKIPDINRPALQLAGFFDHFESQRVQIIGYVEYTYLETLSEEQREKRGWISGGKRVSGQLVCWPSGGACFPGVLR